MADLILGSIVDSITGHVFSLISQEIVLARGVKGELKKLQTTVSIIEALLREADKRHVKSEVVRVWLRELQDVVYDADDLLDDFSSEALLRRSAKGGVKRILNEVRTFFSSSNQIIYASRVAHRVKDIRERIDAITNDKVHSQLGARIGSRPESPGENRVRPETIPFESKPYVIGRDEDKKKVIELLLNPQNEESVSVLPIVGMGGIGKTTLARLIFNDESVKEYFELKLWVCVSTNFNVEDILKRIVRECTQDKELANLSMNELPKRLEEELGGKRFLLVLDDVWNENRNEWLDLQGFLMNGAKGSKILVTTRSPRVAKTMAETFHELSGLLEDESLSLLMQVAMKKEHEWRNHKLESIAREIVRKCVGVPLAVTTMGRLLLFMTNTEEDWMNFTSNDLSRIKQDEGDIMPSLRLSYDFLPSHLKQCFAYCSLFPKDYELDPPKLIYLWMAQGFIKSSENTKTLKEVSQEYFMELVSRSFFQDLAEDSLGNIVRCKMHDLMHDLAMLVAGDNCITIDDSPTSEIPGTARHVSMVDTKYYELKGSGMERIRSMLIYGRYDSKTEMARLDLSRFRNLRALRIQRTKIELLPNSIGKLKHLRSLDLNNNYNLRSLPNSIGKLCNLQSLDLSGCFSLEGVPRGITKLVNLRQLDVSGCERLISMPRGIGKLTSLQMLSDFLVGMNWDSNAEGLNELSRLTRLGRKLRIQYLERLGTNVSSELDASFSIDKLALQSLELNWRPPYQYDVLREYGANDAKILERLRPHPDLKELVIYGCGGTRLSSWISQLQKLVVIEIWKCECKYLCPLDHLPCLKRIALLKLFNLESIELSESVTQQQSLFPSLQELKLEDLRKFKGWKGRSRGNANRIEEGEKDIQEEDMEGSSCLSMLPTFSNKVKVTIQECPRLSYMDQRVLRLTGNIMKNQQKLWENVTSHAPQFTMTFISISSIPLFAPALTSLVISELEDTEKLPSELFRSFPSLKSLVIERCSCLRSLPWKAILRYLTALETLEISSCEELNLSIEDNDGDGVADEHVHDLQLHGHPKLRDLTIRGIDKMESLPGWIQHLTNLERLSLIYCSHLKSLPGWLLGSVTQQQSLFPSLQVLELELLSELKGWKRRRGNANRIEGDEEDIRDEDMEDSSCLSMLPTFSDKVEVTVKCCPRFSYMIKQELQLSGNIMKNWQQLRENVASHAPQFTMKFVSISSIPLFAPALTSLVISELEDTEKLPSELFRSFPSLKSLEITCCSCLRSLPWKAILQYLTALETLEIFLCKELNLSIEDDDGDGFADKHVHNLPLHGHRKLRSLTIYGIDKMESLPGWIQHLTNLERLSLGRCSRLESLPGWLCQLTSLKRLKISNCGEPPRRHWPNIPPHIHNVYIFP